MGILERGLCDIWMGMWIYGWVQMIMMSGEDARFLGGERFGGEVYLRGIGLLFPVASCYLATGNDVSMVIIAKEVGNHYGGTVST